MLLKEIVGFLTREIMLTLDFLIKPRAISYLYSGSILFVGIMFLPSTL
jgi:hypothetical protein